MALITTHSELLQYIVAQQLQPGDLLPPIEELADADHLNCSPGKVREQLAVVRALGLVEVRSRTGTRLKEFDFAPAVKLALFYALAQDMQHFEAFRVLRNHVEIAFWHEACATITDAGKTIMRECVAAARQKLNSHPIHIPNREHRLFHLMVFEQLNNPFVTGLLSAYWDAYDAVEVSHYAEYSYWQTVWDYHERILDAICDGDYDAAQQAFIEHTQLLRYQADIHSKTPDNNGAASPKAAPNTE